MGSQPIFDHAKRQGWLDALTFYGVRHLRSQAVWAFWELCENEWSRVPPKAVPSFEEWRQRALERKICGEVTYSDMALAVEKYIDWEATAQWVRPLLADGIKLPTHVVTELERRLSRAFYRPRFTSKEKRERRSINWRSVIRAAKHGVLRDAKAEGCLDDLMESIRSHPRHVRLMVCGNLWTKEQPEKRVRYYPSFRQWNQTADQYTEAKPKMHSCHRISGQPLAPHISERPEAEDLKIECLKDLLTLARAKDRISTIFTISLRIALRNAMTKQHVL